MTPRDVALASFAAGWDAAERRLGTLGDIEPGTQAWTTMAETTHRTAELGRMVQQLNTFGVPWKIERGAMKQPVDGGEFYVRIGDAGTTCAVWKSTLVEVLEEAIAIYRKGKS